MKNTVLVYLVDKSKNQILLSKKKCGFGSGKLNGAGGKIEADETPQEAALRELREEMDVDASAADLVELGLQQFYFQDKEPFTNTAYLLYRWKGEPRETEEMAEPQWFDIANLPFDRMWQDDPLWLPRALKGERLKGEFWFAADGETMEKYSITAAR